MVHTCAERSGSARLLPSLFVPGSHHIWLVFYKQLLRSLSACCYRIDCIESAHTGLLFSGAFDGVFFWLFQDKGQRHGPACTLPDFKDGHNHDNDSRKNIKGRGGEASGDCRAAAA